jgi:hypothetical protein
MDVVKTAFILWVLSNSTSRAESNPPRYRPPNSSVGWIIQFIESGSIIPGTVEIY